MQGENAVSTGDECVLKSHFQEQFLFSKMTKLFYNELPEEKETVFLCIGNERSSGDCFGPMTGTLLKQLRVPNVLGTLEEPVHAKNLVEVYQGIGANRFIVAVDASLSSLTDLGTFIIRRRPLTPGSAMGRDLPAVGDMSVVLNVSIGGIANYWLLQTASINMVWKGAHILSRAVFTALHMKKKNPHNTLFLQPGISIRS